MISGRGVTILWFGLLCLSSFLAGYLTAMNGRAPERPEPGPAVRAPLLSERLSMRVGNRDLSAAGRWLQAGNIRFPAFPVEPIVTALGGSLQVKEGDDQVMIQVCGQHARIRELHLARRSPGERFAEMWHLQAGRTDRPGWPDPATGVWIRGGELLGSPGWLREELGIEAEWYYPRLIVYGCRKTAELDPARL